MHRNHIKEKFELFQIHSLHCHRLFALTKTALSETATFK